MSYLHSFFAVHDRPRLGTRGDADIGHLFLFGFRHISLHTPDVCARQCMEFPLEGCVGQASDQALCERQQFPTNKQTFATSDRGGKRASESSPERRGPLAILVAVAP